VSSPLVVDRGGDVDRCFVTTGPLATRLALDAVAATPALDRWGLAVQSVFGAPLDLERYRALFARFDRVITVEDGSRHGGLHAFVCALLQDLSLGRVAVRAVSVEGFGPSFRSHEACCAHHGFVPERVRRLALDEASW
jgi:transketolase C-terminal domain/subunit